jgi:hypothetical protein
MRKLPLAVRSDGWPVVDGNGVAGTGIHAPGTHPHAKPFQAAVTLGGFFVVKDNAIVGTGFGTLTTAHTVSAAELNGAGGLIQGEAPLGTDVHAAVFITVETGHGVPGKAQGSASHLLVPVHPAERFLGDGKVVLFVQTSGYAGITTHTPLWMEVKADVPFLWFSHMAASSALALRTAHRTLR